MYDLAAGQAVSVNDAYRHVLHGNPDEVNAEVPALLAGMHPDDRPRLADYWTQWCQGAMPGEVEFRLRRPNAPYQWFCLTAFMSGMRTVPLGWWARCAT